MWKLAGNCQILFQIENENGVMTELDTFLQTFRKLWKYGLDGHLYVECKAGPAWLGLHLPLGNTPGPVHGPLEKVKRNPVTGRRRLRCEAEKNGHFTKFNTKEEEAAAEDKVDNCETNETLENTLKTEIKYPREEFLDKYKHEIIEKRH